jgi:hypothetical protein
MQTGWWNKLKDCRHLAKEMMTVCQLSRCNGG